MRLRTRARGLIPSGSGFFGISIPCSEIEIEMGLSVAALRASAQRRDACMTDALALRSIRSLSRRTRRPEVAQLRDDCEHLRNSQPHLKWYSRTHRALKPPVSVSTHTTSATCEYL